jgi:Cytochrome C oxidase, cbb3-type, subunit III
MRSFLMSRQPRWQIALEMLVLGFLLAIFVSAAFIYTGAYDVSATHRHWPFTEWILETTRVKSVKQHAVGIEPPPGLDDPEKLLLGVDHFAAHCAVCHGAPGVPKGDIGLGLYPAAPDLPLASARYTDGEVFWIIKNGIKMTGMPAWADHSDAEIWATVALIKKLPDMTPEAYGKLIMAAMRHGGHDGQAGTPGDGPQREHGGHQHNGHKH